MPAQTLGSQVPVTDVPVAVRVTVVSVLHTCVNDTPWHSVDGSGPHVSPHSGGGTFEHPGLRSVPTAVRVAFEHRFVLREGRRVANR